MMDAPEIQAYLQWNRPLYTSLYTEVYRDSLSIRPLNDSEQRRSLDPSEQLSAIFDGIFLAPQNNKSQITPSDSLTPIPRSAFEDSLTGGAPLFAVDVRLNEVSSSIKHGPLYRPTDGAIGINLPLGEFGSITYFNSGDWVIKYGYYEVAVEHNKSVKLSVNFSPLKLIPNIPSVAAKLTSAGVGLKFDSGGLLAVEGSARLMNFTWKASVTTGEGLKNAERNLLRDFEVWTQAGGIHRELGY